MTPAHRPSGPAALTLERMLRLAQRGDVALLVLFVAIVSLMLLPMPPALLDALIAINLAMSIGLLMLAMFVGSPLGLSSFPTLLLFTTLLRLSLNIASTKQILLVGHAGHIIETFGKLVVGGNVVVGIVVFLIIAIVQFIVIAKGAERIAEVGARFTLDGMPGKQMSIDADLRVGAIAKDDARRRRTRLEEESQFFGAMDGAMKFVKGDAIASMIIALVNVLAGITVGVVMRDMAFADALQRYTVLSVGDGMVSQLPSLFVSIAAGLLVTRVNSDETRHANLGEQIARQVLDQPVALVFTALVLAGFALTPGLPKLPFGVLALGAGGLGWAMLRTPLRRKSFENTPMPAQRRDGARADPAFIQRGDASVAPLSLRVGAGFAQHVQPAAFDAALAAVRQRIRQQRGLPYPGLAVRYDDELPPQAYVIDVHELPRAQGVLPADWYAEGPAPTSAEAQRSEAWGPFVEGAWHAQRGADADGIRWHTASQVLARHLEWVVMKQPDLFIGFQETHALIEELNRTGPELGQELLRNVPTQRVTDVLRRLVQEGVSIRPFREICESLVAWGPREKDPVLLTEYVRIDLGRYIAHRHARGAAALPVVMLDPAAEQSVRQSIQQSPSGGYLALGPDDSRALLDAVDAALAQAGRAGGAAALVTSMDVRRYVRRLIEARFPELPVLSYQEIGSHVGLQGLGRVLPERRAANA